MQCFLKRHLRNKELCSNWHSKQDRCNGKGLQNYVDNTVIHTQVQNILALFFSARIEQNTIANILFYTFKDLNFF